MTSRRLLGMLFVLALCAAGAGSAAIAPALALAGSYVVYPGCGGAGSYQAGSGMEAYCGNNGFQIDDTGGGATSLPVPAGDKAVWQITAPVGVTISTVSIPQLYVLNVNNGTGWGGGAFWSGGGTPFNPSMGASGAAVNGPYYGIRIVCGWGSCTNVGEIVANGVKVLATENQGPGLVAVGTDNLWYQAGHYVWNPPTDPFSIQLYAADPSGVCSMGAFVGTRQISGPSFTAVQNSFQQCPDPTWTPAQGATVDTSAYIPGSGSLPLSLYATNAAGVPSIASETLAVDNTQPSVSLNTPNDSDPNGWSVNHAVTVDAVGHAGPSGLASLTCSVDGGTSHAYPSAGLSVNGNGHHTISCTSANHAVGPQGQPNTGTATIGVDIDEQPPSLSIEPQDPNNPAQVVADTSDSESKVAGGQIQIAPQGTTNWTPISTAFTSSGQLVATIPDAGLNGPYTIQAIACSQVGNCGSTSETLTMPLRIAATSDVSFAKVIAPAKVVRERVFVGWHYKRERRHGRTVRVRAGGHYRNIRVVIRTNASCASKRVRTGRYRWQEIRVCRTPELKLMNHEQVRYGHAATVHGVLLSGQGVPITNTPVQIWTAPDNGQNQFTQVASTTTSGDGAWQIMLPAGPSRLVQARYPGSATILPATGQVTLTVPAKIRIISIAPRHIPWGGTVKLTGEIAGGYLPASGELVELFYGVGRVRTPYYVKTDVATRRFTTSFTFGAGQTPVTFAFQFRALPDPAYAYGPAWSNTLRVRVGGHATTTTTTTGATHHHKAKKPKHKAKKRRKT